MRKNRFIVAQIVFLIGFLALVACIIFGVVKRDILYEGGLMLDIFWGQFTFIDIYISFIVFFLWVLYRERSISKSILWFILIMLGGSMSICLYMFLAIRGCHYDMKKLLLGKREVM